MGAEYCGGPLPGVRAGPAVIETPPVRGTALPDWPVAELAESEAAVERWSGGWSSNRLESLSAALVQLIRPGVTPGELSAADVPVWTEKKSARTATGP